MPHCTDVTAPYPLNPYKDTKPQADSEKSGYFHKTQRFSTLRVTYVSSSTTIPHFERDFVVPHVMQAKISRSIHTAMQLLSTIDIVSYPNQRLEDSSSKVLPICILLNGTNIYNISTFSENYFVLTVAIHANTRWAMVLIFFDFLDPTRSKDKIRPKTFTFVWRCIPKNSLEHEFALVYIG